MAGYNDSEGPYTEGALGFFTHLGHITDITNKFDKDVTPSVGDVPTWNGTVYAPDAPPSGSGGLYVNVKDYGAVGDGTTDDSAAFIAVHAAARTAIATGFIAGFNKVGRIKIVIPAGRYRLVSDNALMPATSGDRTHGIVYEGAGRGITEIIYDPASSGKNLMRNNDVWLGVTMRGITFWNDTSGSRFLHSTSTGGAQDYFFEDCEWYSDTTKPWEWGIGLDGTNNNSEWEFHRCSIWGKYTKAWLWSGMTAAETDQDQFVNFDFYSCAVFMLDVSQTWLWFDYGGNIRLYGGNYICDQGSRLFYLATNTHAYGVEQLSMFGGRIELRNDTAKTIDCEWAAGQVTFIGVDESTNTFATSPDSITATYVPGDNPSPQIRYQSCRLAGRHEYKYGTNGWNSTRSVVYDQCLSQKEPRNFIVYTANGAHSNFGSRPAIEFRRWKSLITDGQTRIQDQTVGWEFASDSQPTRCLASFKTPQGDISTATITLWLPLYAVVTAVRFRKKATGTATNTNWTYTVRTSEGSPTTLGSAAGGGTVAWNTAWAETDTVNHFVCDTDAKRELDLVMTNVSEAAGGADLFIVVEYWA